MDDFRGTALVRAPRPSPAPASACSAGLLTRAMRSEIRPPDLTSFQRRSSASSASAQAARPGSAIARSSSGALARRFKSHREASEQRSTSTRTCSPWRRSSASAGFSTRSSYRASTGRRPYELPRPRARSPGLGLGTTLERERAMEQAIASAPASAARDYVPLHRRCRSTKGLSARTASPAYVHPSSALNSISQ